MTQKTFTHYTTSNRTTPNIKEDKKLIIELVRAIAKYERVPVDRIEIVLNSITESVTGLLCTNGDTFALNISVAYRVSPATIVTTNQQ